MLRYREHAGRLEGSEREAAQLRSAAEDARAAAAKLEADLEGLSGAYNSLETHSFTLEARLRQLESSAGSLQQGAMAPSGTKAPAEDEEDGDDDDGMNDLLICLGQASHSRIKHEWTCCYHFMQLKCVIGQARIEMYCVLNRNSVHLACIATGV